MDKAERKRLKQQAKQIVERRSQEVRATLAAENPWPVGSPQWVARYKELHPQPKVVATPNTIVEERFFRLTLPGLWSRFPSDAMQWIFRADREQLTVSVMSSSHRMSEHEQLAAVERVTELRRRAETATSGLVSLSDTTFAQSGEVHAARYGGVEPSSRRCFHCLLLCSPSAVTTFYYEALGVSEEESESRARPIFNSIAVG